MKHNMPVIVFCASLTALAGETFLLEGWRFHRGACDNAQSVTLDDASWEKVRIPHDWAISGPFDKEIDKQVVAVVQDGEKVATEKTGRTGALPWLGEGW